MLSKRRYFNVNHRKCMVCTAISFVVMAVLSFLPFMFGEGVTDLKTVTAASPVVQIAQMAQLTPLLADKVQPSTNVALSIDAAKEPAPRVHNDHDHDVVFRFDTMDFRYYEWIALDASKYLYLCPGHKHVGFYMQPGIQGTGHGNIMSQYWFSIAWAYFHKYQWVFINVDETNIQYMRSKRFQHFDKKIGENEDVKKIYLENKYVTGMFNRDVSKMWTRFLPTKMNLTESYKSDICTICGAIDLSLLYHYARCINTTSMYQVPFWFDAIFMVLNREFIDNIYVQNVQQAMKSYTQALSDENEVLRLNYLKSVVIHLRCGDILNMGRKDYEYGFFGLSYVYDVLREWHVYDKIIDNPNEYSLYIIINLNFKDSSDAHLHDNPLGHNKDEIFVDQCRQIVLAVKEGLKTHFHMTDDNVKIIGDGTMSSDTYHMTQAQWLVCGLSSFCHYASFANRNKIALVFPNMIQFDKHKDLVPERFLMFHVTDIKWFYSWQYTDNETLSAQDVGEWIVNN